MTTPAPGVTLLMASRSEEVDDPICTEGSPLTVPPVTISDNVTAPALKATIAPSTAIEILEIWKDFIFEPPEKNFGKHATLLIRNENTSRVSAAKPPSLLYSHPYNEICMTPKKTNSHSSAPEAIRISRHRLSIADPSIL